MNISQHAFVHYTAYYRGRYDNSMHIVDTEQPLVSSYSCLVPYGVNRYQILNVLGYLNYTLLRTFNTDGVLNGSSKATTGLVTFPVSKYFSLTRSVNDDRQVRVVGFAISSPITFTRFVDSEIF